MPDLFMNKILKIKLPQKVEFIINKFYENGFEAFAVGGCIRDCVLGRTPKDWDITTSAKPKDIKTIFKKTVDTGIEHGTVTVLIENEAFEVTTYRIDGKYEDSRHPKSIYFTNDLREDLRRRDFTINAMAYNNKSGFIDIFEGINDIENKIIRCVGSAYERFEEDALRMLRAIRFSAQLGFNIDEDTKNAILKKVQNLKNISAERIRVELSKLIMSDNPIKILIAYDTNITNIILPEFDAMVKTKQTNPYHIYTVANHSIHAVENIKKSNYSDKDFEMLRWTMFLHDVGKPSTRSIDENGIDHFYGHQELSAKMAEKILRRLKFDNYIINMATSLIRIHGETIPIDKKAMRKKINKIGIDKMKFLFD